MSDGGVTPQLIKSLTYTFISLPGLVFSFSWLQTLMAFYLVRMSSCQGATCGPVSQVLINFLSLILLGLEIVLVVFLFNSQTIKYVAIPTVGFILAIKVIAIFVQSKEMKTLSIKTTMTESSFESELKKMYVFKSCLTFFIFLYTY